MKSTNITATKIVCTAIYVLFIVGTLITVGNVDQYIDFNSFLVVAVIAVLFAASAQGEESIMQKFGNGAVRAGWLGSIIGIIAIFGSDYFASGDMSKIGMALAICSLTILYGYFFKLGTIILGQISSIHRLSDQPSRTITKERLMFATVNECETEATATAQSFCEQVRSYIEHFREVGAINLRLLKIGNNHARTMTLWPDEETANFLQSTLLLELVIQLREYVLSQAKMDHFQLNIVNSWAVLLAQLNQHP